MVAAVPPQFPVSPSDWSYIAEGNAHVILRYIGKDPTLSGQVLRILKRGYPANHEPQSSIAPRRMEPRRTFAEGVEDLLSVETWKIGMDSEAEPQVGTCSRQSFQYRVLAPLLGAQFIQPGEPVRISSGDIERLRRSIMNVRPAGRVRKDKGNWTSWADLEPDKTSFWMDLKEMGGGRDQDTYWSYSSSGDTSYGKVGEERLLRSGELIVTTSQSQHRNCNEDMKLIQGRGKGEAWLPLLHPPHSASTIAVEIKPKGALMPTSALVPPGLNRLKYQVLRFRALQKFKLYRGGDPCLGGAKQMTRESVLGCKVRDEDGNQAYSKNENGRDVETGDVAGEQLWGTMDSETSFDPRDFFSGEASKLTSAICKLFEVPQNKLRVWAGGKLVFGPETQGKGKEGKGRSTLGTGIDEELRERGQNLAILPAATTETQECKVQKHALGDQRGDPNFDNRLSSSYLVRENQMLGCKQRSSVQVSNDQTSTVQLAEAITQAGLAIGRCSPEQALASLLGDILSLEPLLGRILEVQGLDVLEVEGAWMVLERLIVLCGGSKEAALDLLCHMQDMPLDDIFDSDGFIEEEVFVLNKEVTSKLQQHPCANVDRIKEEQELEGDLNQTKRLAGIFSGTVISGEDSIELEIQGVHGQGRVVEGTGMSCGVIAEVGTVVDNLDNLHEQAVAAVDQLGRSQCVSLLQRWLLALGACDCSVMISLHTIQPQGDARLQAEDGKLSDGKDEIRNKLRGTRQWCAQKEHSAGELDVGEGLRVAYCLSVIDAGPKPPSKVESKALVERKIWEFLAGYGMSHKPCSE
ncbi:unnamed protein product [Choristocarpus tenellus]